MPFNTDWLKDLAETEVALQETGEIDLFTHRQEEKILKNYTISFLKDLRETFHQHATVFNEHRKDPRQTIKVYSIAQTPSDFLVFRNNLKLVVSYVKPGQIEISFHTLSGGLFSPQKKTSPVTKTTTGDLVDLKLGAFNEPQWIFDGKPINLHALARFYMTEFVKNSIQ